MTEQQKRNEIYNLLTFLKIYIQTYVDSSFTDLTFDLERLITNYLNVFETPDDIFVNVNSIKHNYPAVDLVSVKRDVAIQVTTNADKRKVDKTISTYKKHSLLYKPNNLLLLGLLKQPIQKFQMLKSMVLNI